MEDKLFKVTVSPHLHTKVSTSTIMWEVFLALVPAAAVAVYAFGLSSLMVLVVTTASCVIIEGIYQKLAGDRITALDGSAALTGLLLALNLPPTAPWWLCVDGALLTPWQQLIWVGSHPYYSTTRTFCQPYMSIVSSQ